ncbi:MAG: hypothetical protein K1X78_07390 [Verrucomicrobiaceae bacterium]|nr:hypothetical protein [Verrucomicrobiaceae bacterium]
MSCNPIGSFPSMFLLGHQAEIVLVYGVATVGVLGIVLFVSDTFLDLSDFGRQIGGLSILVAGIVVAVGRAVVGFRRVSRLEDTDSSLMGRARELRRSPWAFSVGEWEFCFEDLYDQVQRDHCAWQLEKFCRWVDLVRAFPNTKFVPLQKPLESANSNNVPKSQEAHSEQAGFLQVNKSSGFRHESKIAVQRETAVSLFRFILGVPLKAAGCLVSMIGSLVGLYFGWKLLRG